jgi:peptide/nickel transport system permease protein
VTHGSYLRYVVYSVARSPLAVVGILLVLFVVVLAIFAPVIATHDPLDVNVREKLSPPSLAHWMGTDVMGRDVFSRVVYGSRAALQISFSVVTIACVLGTLVGLVSGYFGGWTDLLVMRLVDVFVSVPPLILALVAVTAWGPSILNIMIGLALSWWTWYARIVRGEVLKARESGFVLAHKSLGARHVRIMFAHILPNVIGPLLVQTTNQLGYSILYAAALSFLGVGVQPPTPSWGLMISIGHQYLPDFWWMSVFPGLLISMLVTGFLLLGDSLRDVIAREVK